MDKFLKTTHLSEILEKSNESPVIIFKYSSECGSSPRLSIEFQKAIDEKIIIHPVYIVVIQNHRTLSNKIEELFQIKHESPQIIILSKGKVTYTAHHRNINIKNFKYN